MTVHKPILENIISSLILVGIVPLIRVLFLTFSFVNIEPLKG